MFQSHLFDGYAPLFLLEKIASEIIPGFLTERNAVRVGSGSCDIFIFFRFAHTSTFQNKPWSQVSSLLPPGSSPSIFIAHKVQQPHCSSIFHRVLLTHALALSASPFVHKKKSPRIYTSMHSGGFERTKLTYTRLEDNLIRHRGDLKTFS